MLFVVSNILSEDHQWQVRKEYMQCTFPGYTVLFIFQMKRGGTDQEKCSNGLNIQNSINKCLKLCLISVFWLHVAVLKKVWSFRVTMVVSFHLLLPHNTSWKESSMEKFINNVVVEASTFAWYGRSSEGGSGFINTRHEVWCHRRLPWFIKWSTLQCTPH